eukprot:2123516-Heterocapsa_arctica.AAC.1
MHVRHSIHIESVIAVCTLAAPTVGWSWSCRRHTQAPFSARFCSCGLTAEIWRPKVCREYSII